MSGLAIDGNIVHGLAIKGQAFIPKSSVEESSIGKTVSGLTRLNGTSAYFPYKFSDGIDWHYTSFSTDCDTGTVIGEAKLKSTSIPYVAIRLDSGDIATGSDVSGNTTMLWFDTRNITVKG